jgi:hypothetical protein
MRVSPGSSVLLVFLLAPFCFSQLPSSRCDSTEGALKTCIYLPQIDTTPERALKPDAHAVEVRALQATDGKSDSGQTTMAAEPSRNDSFHWRRALTESFTFLVIEQAYVVHTDFNWVVSENGIPFNHYWRDYMQSLSEWTHSGWNDGDPNWFGYVGHPIQGALTGFIQIQNDPRSEKLEFSKTKEYWWSRLKAGLWNAAYSTQWNLGPLSEVTVEKYGTKTRPPNNYNGTYPCFRHCLTGVGQIDIVMTPLGGTGWLISEDFLDSKIVRRVEDGTQNRLLIDAVRVALNPIRGGANVLHGKPLWYRASRDAEGMPLMSSQKAAVSTPYKLRTQVPDRGNVFFGYTRARSIALPRHLSEHDRGLRSAFRKELRSQWLEPVFRKKYLRYFCGSCRFQWTVWWCHPERFLVWSARGSADWEVAAVCRGINRAVHARENGLAAANSATSFAEALGRGSRFPTTKAARLAISG